ncbi:MAG: hypothetical protein E7453_03475 [Ruminococcaceae bacterium]|nr:hypothetical protein [Oscillospiraceae bacterium]
MLTYEFYTDSYFGSSIPEAAFPHIAARAEAALSKMKRIYRVESTGALSERMALCAMAETIYDASRRHSGISQVRMGEMTVSYRDSKALSRELVGKASMYLDLYRGVTV